MFRIEESRLAPRERRVVDTDRDVWLQFVSGHGMETGTAFKLVWGERIIPFDAVREHQTDPQSGEEYYRTRLLSFGHSIVAETRAGLAGYRFKSSLERHRAIMLAVEALLIFGSHYDGDRQPEGYDRVEYMGCDYTRRDFEPPSWHAFLRRAHKRWQTHRRFVKMAV